MLLEWPSQPGVRPDHIRMCPELFPAWMVLTNRWARLQGLWDMELPLGGPGKGQDKVNRTVSEKTGHCQSPIIQLLTAESE